MEDKSSSLGWIIIAIVAIVAIVGLVLLVNGNITGKATVAPGTGTAITSNIDLANACNVKLYGAGVQLAKPGAKSAVVDDAALSCVQASGGTGTGGTCDPASADGCSSSYSLNLDPDADPTVAVFDVLASGGTTVESTFYLTQNGQVLGLKPTGCCIENGVCKPTTGTTICQLCDCGSNVGSNCAKPIIDSYKKPLTCESAKLMAGEILSKCVGFDIALRLCPEPPIVVG